MRKSLLIGMVASVIIIAITIALAASMLPKQAADTKPANSGQQTPASQTAQPPQQATPGVYTDYSAAKVNQTGGTKILFFHASWCPQCRELDKSIKAGAIPANVTIFKVDYDTNQVLRQKYGVTVQTTLVKIDDSGAMIKKYVAYDMPTLQALIENLL